MHARNREAPSTNYRSKCTNKARHIDQAYCNVSADQCGPVEKKLNSFGDLLCLVVGQFADCSQDLQDLIIRFAEEKVKNVTRSGGAPVPEWKLSLILQQYRRRLSVCAIRAQSACLLSRLGQFSDGARLAAQRRAAFMSREEANRRDLRVHWEATVRGRRLHKSGFLHL